MTLPPAERMVAFPAISASVVLSTVESTTKSLMPIAEKDFDWLSPIPEVWALAKRLRSLVPTVMSLPALTVVAVSLVMASSVFVETISIAPPLSVVVTGAAVAVSSAVRSID